MANRVPDTTSRVFAWGGFLGSYCFHYAYSGTSIPANEERRSIVGDCRTAHKEGNAAAQHNSLEGVPRCIPLPLNQLEVERAHFASSKIQGGIGTPVTITRASGAS